VAQEGYRRAYERPHSSGAYSQCQRVEGILVPVRQSVRRAHRGAGSFGAGLRKAGVCGGERVDFRSSACRRSPHPAEAALALAGDDLARFLWHSGLQVVREIRKTSPRLRRRRRAIIVSMSHPHPAQRHSSPRGGVSARRARLSSSSRRSVRRAAHSGEHVTAPRRRTARPRRSRSFSVAARERPHSEQRQGERTGGSYRDALSH
jgi:hypothetical protein